MYSQVQFSEYSNSTYLGASFTGIDRTEISIKNRDQFVKIPNNFSTYNFSAQHYLDNYKSGIGVEFNKTKESLFYTNNVSILYSFDFKILKKINFRPGIEFDYNYFSIDNDKLIFRSQINSENGEPFTNRANLLTDSVMNYFNASSSFLMYSDKFQFCVGLSNLLRQKSFTYNEENQHSFILYKIYFNYFIYPNSGLKLQNEYVNIFILYKNYFRYDQFDIGANWNNKYLILGAKYRGFSIINFKQSRLNNESIIATLGFKLYDFDLIYNYDFTVSKLVGSGGAHEITINYYFNKRKNLKAKIE